MIKNCFMDEQPDFFKDVFVDDEKIATIKALSRNDRSIIEKEAVTKQIKKGEIVIEVNSFKTQIVRMRLSLTGHKNVGWEFDREVTDENIGLLPDKYFNAIDVAINELENWDKEGISKN